MLCVAGFDMTFASFLPTSTPHIYTNKHMSSKDKQIARSKSSSRDFKKCVNKMARKIKLRSMLSLPNATVLTSDRLMHYYNIIINDWSLTVSWSVSNLHISKGIRVFQPPLPKTRVSNQYQPFPSVPKAFRISA